LKRSIFYILILFSQSLFSQESSLIFSRFNLSVFNPAFAGVEGPAINLNTRAQWIGIEDAPLTNYLIVHFPEKKNATLGLTIQNDRVFVENKTLLTLDYSYRLKLSDNSNLSLGLKAGGMFFNVDTNNIPRIYTTPNQSISSLGNYFSPVLGVGLSFISKNIFLGVAAPGLLNKIGLSKNNDWELTSRDFTYLHLSGGFNINLSDKFTVKPSVNYRSIPIGPNLINSILEVDYSDRFSLGSLFTNNNTIGAFFKLKSKKGFHIGYGYEFLSGNDRESLSNSTHELMLRIDLKSKKNSEVNKDTEIDNNIETQENEN
jgi:type IX secretion system PorP/SprF family membrane protein